MAEPFGGRTTPIGALAGTSTSASDEALLDAVRRGAPGSRETLYHQHKRRVFALAARIAGAAEAEEVAQEAFIRIFRGLPKFRGESALGTWIYRLTVNVALSHRTRRPAAEVAKSRALLTDLVAEEPVATDAVLARRLATALEELPKGYRAVVVLHDVEGLEHEEIADILGCHVGTSKSQLHKARARLREILARQGITQDALFGGRSRP